MVCCDKLTLPEKGYSVHYIIKYLATFSEKNLIFNMKVMQKFNVLRNEVLERYLFKRDLLKIKKRPIDKEINGIIEKYNEIKKTRHKEVA